MRTSRAGLPRAAANMIATAQPMFETRGRQGEGRRVRLEGDEGVVWGARPQAARLTSIVRCESAGKRASRAR